MSGVPDPPPPDVPVRAAGAVTPPVADNGAVESQAPAAAGRNPAPGPREVVILGSTGPLGPPTLHIITRQPHPLRGAALAAGGGNPELLARQAAEFGVAAVAVADPGAVPAVQAALRALFSRTDSATTAPP